MGYLRRVVAHDAQVGLSGVGSERSIGLALVQHGRRQGVRLVWRNGLRAAGGVGVTA